MIGAKSFGEKLAKRLREHAQAQLETANAAITSREMRSIHMACSLTLSVLADVILEVTQ